MQLDRMLLPAIAAFSEVAREGGITPAARRLGVSPSALSQTIRTLEERVGVRLLNRSTRSVSLTDEGRLLLTQVEPNLISIAQALTTLGDARSTPSGEIRVTMSRVVAKHFVEPHLGEFVSRYPQISLELLVEESFNDIVREGCDAGIRLRESVIETMVAVPVTLPVSMAVVASPAYFASTAPPRSPTDLVNHNCIGFRQPTGGSIYGWEFTDPESGRDVIIHPRGCLIANADEVMIGGALQGLGVAMHVDFAVAAHIADGTLVRVLEEWCPSFDGFHIYVPSRDNMPAKLRAFIDFLVEKRRLAERTSILRPHST